MADPRRRQREAPPEPGALLTCAQAGQILGYGSRGGDAGVGIRNLIRRHNLPCYRFGSSIRIRREDLDVFVESHREGPPAGPGEVG